MKIEVGDRFCELPDSKRYGPKRWRVAPLRPKDIAGGVKRRFVEIELTPVDRLQAELGGVTDFFESSPVITEADAIAEPAMKAYVGGRAVFPKVENINTSTDAGKARATKQEADWQESALRMHENQQPLPRLAEKPSDDSTKGLYFKELKRSD